MFKRLFLNKYFTLWCKLSCFVKSRFYEADFVPSQNKNVQHKKDLNLSIKVFKILAVKEEVVNIL